jgi:anti-sigma B factor antagonist
VGSSLRDELELTVSAMKVGRHAHSITVRGEVDMYSAPELREALDAVPPSAKHVLVDLSTVSFVDSVGLATLLNAAKRLEASGGRMLLVVDDPRVLRILAVTGIDRWFSIRSSDADTARELVGASVLESLSVD